MAAALPYVMIGMSVLGTLQGASQAQKQGDAAASAAQFNANVATRNAAVARQQAADDAAAQRRMGIKAQGAARAAYGASGVTLAGSPLDVLASSASNAELDHQQILFKGNLKALGYEDMAALDNYSGAVAEEAGNDKASGILLGGIAQAGSQAYSMKIFGGGSAGIGAGGPDGYGYSGRLADY